MTSVAEKLNEAESILRANGVANARGEASLLLALSLNRDKTFLIAHPEYVLSQTEADTADEFIRRRARHEPFQYISGTTEFYGLEFNVTPDVLIPRPETEMVVERAIELLDGEASTFCEIGIGSGCISISILFHVANSTGVGTDISPAAISIARLNAERHRVSDRLRLVDSDVFSALTDQKFDLILSNPPYVPARDRDGLQAEVRDFEPHVALFGGDDGLTVIRRIIDEAPRYLHPGGHLLMEIGFDQSEKVAGLFHPTTWKEIVLFPDLQGIPRLVSARLD